MARQARLDIPHYLHLICLRGHNQQAIFRAPEDYALWLDLAVQKLPPQALAVHGLCLLPTRIYALVTPAEAGQISLWVQSIGRSFVRLINQRYERSGTLFEGRYRAGIAQAGTYLLPLMQLLDQLPVQQGLTSAPAEYAYSSAAFYSGQVSALQHPVWKALLTAHPQLWQLGNTPYAREQAYADHLLEPQDAGTSAQMRQVLAQLEAGWALGDAAFLAQLQSASARRVHQRARGRPRKHPPAG